MELFREISVKNFQQKLADWFVYTELLIKYWDVHQLTKTNKKSVRDLQVKGPLKLVESRQSTSTLKEILEVYYNGNIVTVIL